MNQQTLPRFALALLLAVASAAARCGAEDGGEAAEAPPKPGAELPLKRADWSMKDAPLADALAYIKEAYGWTLEAKDVPEGTKITVERKQASLMEGLAAVLTSAHLKLEPYEWTGQPEPEARLPFRLVPSPEGSRALVAAQGPFLVRINTLRKSGSEVLSLQMGSTKRETSEGAQGDVYLAPFKNAIGAWQVSTYKDAKGERHTYENALNESGFSRDSAKPRVKTMRMFLRPVEGEPMRWHTRVRVAEAFEERKVENLGVKAEHEIEVHGGKIKLSTSEGKPGQASGLNFSGPNEAVWHVLPDIPRDGQFSSSSSMSGGDPFGDGPKEPPADQAGFFLLGADGAMLSSLGAGVQGSAGLVNGRLYFNGKPEALLVRWCLKVTAYDFEFDFSTLPALPDPPGETAKHKEPQP